MEVAEKLYPYIYMATPELPNHQWSRSMSRLFDLWNDEMTSCEYSFMPLLDDTLEIMKTALPPKPTVVAYDSDGDGFQHWIHITPHLNLHITDGFIQQNWLWQELPHYCDIEYENFNQTIVPTDYSWGGWAESTVNPSAVTWDFDGELGDELVVGYKEWSGYGGDLRTSTYWTAESTTPLTAMNSGSLSAENWEPQVVQMQTTSLAAGETCAGRECGHEPESGTWCGPCPEGIVCTPSGACEGDDAN